MRVVLKYLNFCHTLKGAYVYVVMSSILFTRHKHTLSFLCIYFHANHCTSNYIMFFLSLQYVCLLSSILDIFLLKKKGISKRTHLHVV
jgi:hypothetical protein